MLNVLVSFFRSRSAPPPLNVLVVDDEEPVRRFVSRVLTDAGLTVWPASDGVEALQLAPTIEPLDLLLTDLMMPSMNGDELARRLRTREPDLRVLYLTGFSDQLFADQMTLSSNESFLDKPCSVKALLEAVSLRVTDHTSLAATPAITAG